MKIIFAGTPDFAVPALQMLIDSEHEVCAVYTQPDRPAGRGRKLTSSPVKTLALEVDIPVFQPESFTSDEEIKQLSSFSANLMVVVAYGIILPQIVLDTPKLGCLNIHGSLLPRWRGAAPIHRAVIAGDEKTGVTIIKLIQKLDAGDMLHKEECIITQQTTSADLHNKLADLGALALKKVLHQIDTNTLQSEKQDELLVTYASKLSKHEALLQWDLSATELSRKVRGFNSWPVAHTIFEGKVLRIWDAVADENEINLTPGTVVQRDNKMIVATGKGMLDILEVQLPGGKRMVAKAFMNAHAVDGIKLGESI